MATSDKKTRIADIGNVPGAALDAYSRAKNEWAERNGNPVVSEGRMFVITLLAVICAVSASLTLMGIFPLKTVVPYRIDVDKLSGEARAMGIADQKWVPNDNTIKFFLGRFSEDLVGIPPSRDITEQNLNRAFIYTRQVATSQFKDFMKTTAPMQRLKNEAGLSREVKILSIQPVNETTYMIRLQTVERSNAVTAKPLRFQMTVHYVTDPPKNADDEMMLKNPAGIFITNFLISQELS